MIDTAKIKKDFPVLVANPELVYLDSVASSQTPQVVIGRMDEYYTKYRSNVHRGLYEASQEATSKYEEARERVAGFIGAEKDEVVFTSGVTGAMNMLCYGLERTLELHEGDEIVATVAEHHSILVPLQELAKRKKLIFKHIPITDSFDFDYEKAKSLITKKTKLVAVSYVSRCIYIHKIFTRITLSVSPYVCG